jgi:hypothetical protein
MANYQHRLDALEKMIAPMDSAPCVRVVILKNGQTEEEAVAAHAAAHGVSTREVRAQFRVPELRGREAVAMTTSYDRRLVALEQKRYRAAPQRVRVIHTIISPGRAVVGMHLNGRYIDRDEGESVEELRERALRAVGWDD